MKTRALPFAFALSLALAPALRAPAQDTAPAAPAKSKAVAWFALRSYERVEQRLREFTQLAKTPGLDEMALGIVKMRLKGLGGLDKTRPIVAAYDTLDFSEGPRFLLRIPCADRNTLVETVRAIYPDVTEAQGTLHFEGGPGEAFGRFDGDNAALSLAPSAAALAALEAAVPADLFPAQGGPDIVWRFDAETARRQKASGWGKMEERIEDGVKEALDKIESESKSEAEKTFRKAALDLLAGALGQALDDLAGADVRLTLAPEGWAFELDTRTRPGSPTAGFLEQQAARASPAAAFLPAKSAFRGLFGMRVNDDVRKAALALLKQGRQAAEAELAAQKNLAEEAREAKSNVIAKAFPLLEQWLEQGNVEAAFEIGGTAKQPEFMLWLPFPKAAQALETILDVAEKANAAESGKKQRVARSFDQHGATPIHRVEMQPSEEAGRKGPKFSDGFLAGEGNWLVLQAGASPDPLKRFLDRVREGSQVAAKGAALFRMEFFFADMLELGFMDEGSFGRGTPGRALFEKMAQDAAPGFTVEVQARKDGAAFRCGLSGPFVRAAAETIGEQVQKQMPRPGAAPPENQ